MKAAIFDIDGTLADIRHRLHHVARLRDWEAFFAEVSDDTIVEPIRDLAIMIDASGVPVVLCSGRPERLRVVTEGWLRDNGVPFVALYMRPDGDHRPDHTIKAQILAGIREDGYEPFIVIDDRQSVVDMWRENDLVCLQCAPSEQPPPSAAILTLMVGPSGGGKTTWLASSAAKELDIFQHHILNSDQIREDLCGDFRDQTKNDAVFAALNDQAKVRLKHGLNTVIDATHLRRKDRLASVELAHGGPVRYIVVDRPMADKRLDAGWRAGLPFDLIAKHDQTFKSQLDDILAGDDLPNVTVYDERQS
jgi:predicted kinase